VNSISKKNFFLSVSVIVIAYSALSWLFSALYAFDTTQNTALIVSGILGTVNIVISFIILTVSYDKDIKGFMVNYFGGMGIRLLFLLLTIFLILKFMRIDIFVFILSLFVLYFIFQILEIYYIHSYQKRK
jgi:hypothetical protein